MFLRAFATLLATFWRVKSGVSRDSEWTKAKTRTGLAFVVSHPCLKNKGMARMGHPAFLVAATIFRIFSRMAFALQTVNSIVRFWGLIACKVPTSYLAGLVVCFVGFRDGAGIGGLDK